MLPHLKLSSSILLRFAAHTNVGAAAKVHKQSSSLPVLTLFTKENCQLCEEAKWEIREAGLREGRDFRLVEVDIEEEGNEEVNRKFRLHIPVFELDGRPLCRHRIDIQKLREKLEKA